MNRRRVQLLKALIRAMPQAALALAPLAGGGIELNTDC